MARSIGIRIGVQYAMMNGGGDGEGPPTDPGEGVDNYITEAGDNYLTENGVDVYLLE